MAFGGGRTPALVGSGRRPHEDSSEAILLPMLPLGDVLKTRTTPWVATSLVAVTVLVSMVVHGGVWHLAVNVLYLWIFAPSVEDRMGHGRFLGFYLLCGLVAAAVQTLTQASSPEPIIGAGGAVSGVLGAYLRLFPTSRVLTLVPFQIVELPALLFLGIWFLMQLASGLGTLGLDLSGGVAFWAHLAGLAAGAGAARLFARPERMTVDWWDQA